MDQQQPTSIPHPEPSPVSSPEASPPRRVGHRTLLTERGVSAITP